MCVSQHSDGLVARKFSVTISCNFHDIIEYKGWRNSYVRDWVYGTYSLCRTSNISSILVEPKESYSHSGGRGHQYRRFLHQHYWLSKALRPGSTSTVTKYSCRHIHRVTLSCQMTPVILRLVNPTRQEFQRLIFLTNMNHGPSVLNH